MSVKSTSVPLGPSSTFTSVTRTAWTATSSCFGGFELDDNNKFGRLINRAAEDSAELGVRFVLQTNTTT